VLNGLQGPLIEHCKSTLNSFYGDDPQSSDSFGRIVNNRHFKYVTCFVVFFAVYVFHYYAECVHLFICVILFWVVVLHNRKTMSIAHLIDQQKNDFFC